MIETKIKRYDMIGYASGDTSAYEDENGEYIKYVDFEKTRKDLSEWIESIKWDAAESFMEPENYVVSFDELKQKIEETL